jgi:hypothetical protein
MTIHTIARLYDRYDDAEETIQALHGMGVPHDDVSVIANNAGERSAVEKTGHEAANQGGVGAEIGAGLGAIAGGGAGVLAGLGMLAIPGVGPVVAAGWLVALAVGAVGGAVAGGFVGGLVGSGISKEHAETYAEGVRRGGTLVTVRVPSERAAAAEAVMDSNHAVDPEIRRATYASEGWSGYDAAAPDYTREEITRERELLHR